MATDERLVRWQLRRNGELLLRTRPPADGAPMRAVENGTWSEHWTAFYEQHPHLRPRLERSSTFPRERLHERLAELLRPDREYVLVASLHGHRDAVGIPAATVAGSGGAVAAYAVDLVEAGHEDLYVLDDDAGTALLVERESPDDPGLLLLEEYRWPEVDD